MTDSIPGPESAALAARLRAAESANVTFLGVRFPVFWETATGCTVRDVDGNSYLDTTAAFGVAALGHGHPAVVEAVREQAARLLHGMGDVHPPAPKVALCEALRDCAPFTDGRVILTGGGAEAVEAALKTAAITTGKPGVIAFEGAYHGLSYGALATTHRADFRAPWHDQLGQHVAFAPFPTAPDHCDSALAAIDRLLREGTPAGPVGALLFEPIQGRGGVRVPAPGFLRNVVARAREAGALCIADEIFTGLGRTGRFWACEHDGVTPDLVVCGKPLGGGMPIGASIGSPDAMAGWPPSAGEALHTSTFLGHPVVCAAACAALTALRGDGMGDTVRARGEQLEAGLRALAAREPHLREVRGRGLMLGLVTDSADTCSAVVQGGLREGLILLGGGMGGDVLTFTPPFTIVSDEVDEVLRRLARAVARCRP